MKEQEFIFDSSKQKIFFTSDTHFWHVNIIKYCNRPFETIEEMNETIIERWNSKISKDDIVFHLGDFAFCGSSEYNKILSRLNGKITLVLGNHDWKSLKEGYINKFNGVYQQLRIRIDGQRIYLNHFPLLCFDGAYKGLEATWQLFGHVHSSKVNTNGYDNQRLQYLFATQLDVGVDGNDFYPYQFEEIKQIIENQQMSLGMYRKNGVPEENKDK